MFCRQLAALRGISSENSDTPKTYAESSEEYEIIAERYRTTKPDLTMRNVYIVLMNFIRHQASPSAE